MTKDELKALIKAKIEGQGSAIDAGSVLPSILYGIIELETTSVETEDIAQLTAAQLESLKPGDNVVKEDATGQHVYTVSYKGDGGLCLTYADCENVETIAYTKSGSTWSYDSKDMTSIAAKEDALKITAASGTALTAKVSRYYVMTGVNTLAITLPTITGASYANVIAFSITTGDNPNITFTGGTIKYEGDWEIAATSRYEISALWNGSDWTITSVEFSS